MGWDCSYKLENLNYGIIYSWKSLNSEARIAPYIRTLGIDTRSTPGRATFNSSKSVDRTVVADSTDGAANQASLPPSLSGAIMNRRYNVSWLARFSDPYL